MGEVTIDSIQIEIESSSTNAAKGIDALAGSLEKLKKNGSFKTVSNNLNNLSTALKNLPNVHSAANSLRTLANSIEKLKGVGSVSSLSNSLTKLPTALKSLSNINLDRVAPQVQRVADAVSPLSSIKSGGLNTMVNSMKKLGEVTDSLDDDTIERFAKKVELLNSKLAPLSEKMSSIKVGFNAINSSARSATKSVEDFGDGINTSTLNMSSFIDVAKTAIDTVQGIIRAFSDIIAPAIEWDGISARFGRGFGAQAEETYAWIQRLNEEMGINTQEFMKYSSVYSTMLTGFGVASEDAGTMALGYMELTYDIWAGYNDVYSSLEETAEAVKSAIAGEVEPVRRAGFTIVEATLEQTAANHGLEISLANATEAEKSYLRYLTLIDQAHAQSLVGTYAKELNAAEGMMRTFAQQVKSLTQTFGSLFLPILVKVMPWLQAFVELLTDGVYWLANLLGVEIQAVDFSGYESGANAIENVANSASGATDSLNDATKAAKDLKNATLGIDELNVISPNTSSSSSDAAGGSGSGVTDFGNISSLWDETIFDSIQSDVDLIKEKLKNLLPAIAGIATALLGLELTHLLDDIDDADLKLKNLTTTAGKAISIAGITLAVGTLVWDFTGAYLEGGDETDLLKAIGTTVLGTALAYWLAKGSGAAFTLTVSGIVTLTKLGIEIGEGNVEWNSTESLVTAAVGLLETVIGGVFAWKTIGPKLAEQWPKLTAAISTALGSSAFSVAGIVAAIAAVLALAFVDYDFSDVSRQIGEKIGSVLKWAFDNLTSIGLSIKLGKWLMKELNVDTVWDLIKEFFTPKTWTDKIIPSLEEAFTNVKEWIMGKIENFRENVNEIASNLLGGIFDGLGIDISWAEKFAEIFDIEYMDIVDLVVSPWSIGYNIIQGIIDGILSGDLWGNIVGKFTEFVDNVKEFFGIHSPSTLMRDEIGKNLVAGITDGMSLTAIKNRLSSMWTEAKKWWKEKKEGLSEYTPSIGDISKKLSTAWTNAKTWWNTKKTAMASYTPSIGSLKSKVYSSWKDARDWWNTKKGNFSTYTPSIGSITDKLKSAWSSAKTWWSKNVKLETKLNVKVPTIKVNWEKAEAFGKSFKYPTGFSLKFAADGGIFDAGSLIWAGERGPEIVANASGGKTGVMNVQQMQDAVYEGVYAAMVSAMRGNNGGGSSQVIKVYLDGKEITHTVEQHQRERGASIMGNEVYSY